MSLKMLDFLSNSGISYLQNVDLSKISAIKIGGIAKTVIYPESEDELCRLLSFLLENEIPFRVIGGATNVLFGDGEIETVIVSTLKLCDVKICKNSVLAQCGARLANIFSLAKGYNLGGAEELCGIPGTLGGAIAGNAGAFGKEIADFIEFVNVFDHQSGKRITLEPSDCGFGYRRSRFGRCFETVLSAGIDLNSTELKLIEERTEKFRALRAQTQPIGKPSLGCAFKKAGGVSCAKLIDECGLKGHKIGGASISDKHAGFIVNDGGAKAADYTALCYLAQKCIFEKYHVTVEPEIKLIMR